MREIKKLTEEAMKEAGIYKPDLPEVSVEAPNERSNGDFSTNIALLSAGILRSAPMRTAGMIAEKIRTEGTHISRIETAAPGFINFYLSDDYLYEGLEGILDLGEDFGSLDIGKGSRIMVEYVSANPTGPLHMGNARGGALGDLIAAVLEKAGYCVTREFLINDAGNQMDKFACSLEARYMEILMGKGACKFPEDGYAGEDIVGHARDFADIYGSSLLNLPAEQRREKLAGFALERNINAMRGSLESYGILFDNWFSEQSLFDSGELEESIKYLDDKGYTYEHDNAKWFRSSLFGCSKDDVLVRNNGVTTYFASDIAYHRNKFHIRGFDRVINLLGADHHGHVARMKAACRALGVEDGRFELIVFQLVRLIKDGQTVKMSKRTGKAISLDELICDVGRDAVRFFFNMKASGSHLDFDMDLAAKQSEENPVFYVQYAYARICSILRKIDEEGIRTGSGHNFRLLDGAEEKKLIDKLLDYPEEIRICAGTLEPSRLTRYAIDTAALFHSFYNAKRVIVDDPLLFSSRLKLVEAVRIVLKNVLDLMKISAPERM